MASAYSAGVGEENSETSSDSIAIVYKYVAAHKGWKTSDYTISEDHKERGFTVYLVFYLPDKKMGYPGGGKSFLAYYNLKNRSVTKEIGFQ